MTIKLAEYTASYVEVSKCPKEQIAEFAFIGRSNVGKSSLINYLCGRKALTKVSNTPGKTQTLNFFNIDNRLNLVDLPGYSYARVSKERREVFLKMIRSYIINRKQLQYVFVLIDSRIEPQRVDLDFIGWLAQNHIPIAIIFTKADFPGARQTNTNVQLFGNEMLKEWEALPPFFVTSAERKNGKEKVWQFINSTVQEFNSQTG